MPVFFILFMGAFLNVVTWLTLLVIDLILYLCLPVLYMLMSLFCGFSSSEITWVCASDASTFIFQNFISGKKINWGNC